MEDHYSVSSPRGILSLSKKRRASVFFDRDDRGPGFGLSGDHGPKPSEVYGFVGSITTVVATVIYLIWAYVPESWLHSIGIFYYPSRYWAVMVSIALAWLFYIGLNFLSTPPPTSFNIMFEEELLDKGFFKEVIYECYFRLLHSQSMAMAATFVTVPKPFIGRAQSSSVSSRTQLIGGLRTSSLKISAVAKKWEPAKVVPQADRVLIRLEELPEKSAGGVLLPKSAVKFERHLVGEILSIGPEVGGSDIAPGKKVLLSDINAYEVDLGTDAKHCFCKAGDLLAVVE